VEVSARHEYWRVRKRPSPAKCKQGDIAEANREAIRARQLSTKSDDLQSRAVFGGIESGGFPSVVDERIYLGEAVSKQLQILLREVITRYVKPGIGPSVASAGHSTIGYLSPMEFERRAGFA
jgi:hypothetical protein